MNRQQRFNRRGSVLPLFAVMLFALIPLMALAVHLGTVYLARRQMQSAVNHAALEGLRHRDVEVDPNNPEEDCCDPNNPEEDCPDRPEPFRCKAKQAAERVLHANAGAELDFSGGIPISETSSFRASQLIEVIPSEEVKRKTQVELNTSNALSGDIVLGIANPDATHHRESADFSRSDFRRAEPDEEPDAVLVRLRRVGLEEQDEGSSVLSPIPFLFGRAGLTRAEGDNPLALYDRRARGTYVRATAIAQARPAITVGGHFSETTSGFAGISFFESVLNSWIPSESSETLSLRVFPSGEIRTELGAIVGIIAAVDDDQGAHRRYVSVADRMVTQSHENGSNPLWPNDLVTSPPRVYTPIVSSTTLSDSDDTALVVIGFKQLALIEIEESAEDQEHLWKLTFRMPEPEVAEQNAMATWPPGHTIAIGQEDFQTVWTQFQNLNGSDDLGMLLAPALIRAID